ncbi:unnamed protein product [Mycena citricolor]|uniref:Defective in cullin neddylation protein n=1 Tax=Mycena citricolor TaxID=2018698 RepID=A0AAD2HMY6_9AGAR|nr:unnamed protein product [Mycena citricolor]
MPPKRKRATDDTTGDTNTSTRPTRSSTRKSTSSNNAAGTSNNAVDTNGTASSSQVASGGSEAEPSAAKKPRTSKISGTKGGTKKGPAKGKKAAAVLVDDAEDNASLLDEPSAPSTSKIQVAEVPLTFIDSQPPSRSSVHLTPESLTTHSSIAPPPPVAAPVPTLVKPEPPMSKIESYSADRCVKLFAQYTDEDDRNVIGPEGFERLCTDADISLEGAGPLILAWQLNAKDMGKFTREEWTKGLGALKISSCAPLCMAVSDLDSLLIRGEPAVKAGRKDAYDKTAYTRYAADVKKAFGSLYTFCFNLAKPEQSRNIDMETSMAFWSVLLLPQFPIMKEVLEFITEKNSYKATNKDLWSMMLEFCRTVKPTLQDYEADGAWPTLLDDFVAWKQEKMEVNGGP